MLTVSRWLFESSRDREYAVIDITRIMMLAKVSELLDQLRRYTTVARVL